MTTRTAAVKKAKQRTVLISWSVEVYGPGYKARGVQRIENFPPLVAYFGQTYQVTEREK